MSNSPHSVLIVDDEPGIIDFLADNLASDDFAVHVAESAHRARELLQRHRPTIALLDVGLPDGSGYDVCREIRSSDPLRSMFDPDMPIIMLTARVDEVDRIRAFDRGADDFVPKPFSYPELLARIRALLRRTSSHRREDVLVGAGVAIDFRTRRVTIEGIDVALSGKEFSLLAALARDPRRVYSKRELLETVWGFQSGSATRTLDSHASRLRRKLREIAPERAFIDNVWGVGYRLVPES